MPDASPWVLGARSETGFVRSSNEDRMGWTRSAWGDVFVVCDGMGGQRGGALAAEIAVQRLQQALAAIEVGSEHFGDGMRRAFEQANRAVHEQRQAGDPETCDMGTTAVAVVSDGARAMVAHVGDSRAYLFRRRDGLRQVTRDHSRVQTLIDSGQLAPAEALNHPQASLLERAIGHAPTVEVDVTDWIALDTADMLLLCSDGLSAFVPEATIEALLRNGLDPQQATDRLVEEALAQGGQDNVTVQLARYVGPAPGAPMHGSRPRYALAVSASVAASLAVSGAVGWRATEGMRQTIERLKVEPAGAADKASGGSGSSGPSSAASNDRGG